MPVETAAQVEQFLLLQSKTTEELKAICEGLGLGLEGSKTELVRRLVSVEDIHHQQSPTKPQAIPLKTRGSNGQTIPVVVEMMKQWRKVIFNGGNNYKTFGLIDSRGKTYEQELRYARCSIDVLNIILNNKWYMASSSQEELIDVLKKHPEKFTLSIIQKPGKHGSSWLMLHVSLRAA